MKHCLIATALMIAATSGAHEGHDHFQSADFNRDGRVDRLDLVRWAESYDVDAGGDANADGRTDAADFAVWQTQLTPPAPPPDPTPDPTPDPDPTPTPTPEPLPHPDDPAKQAEHLAMMALVPTAAADVRAVKSGAWSDPATWSRAPAAGDRVWIPQGVFVSVDGQTVSLKWLRVDGTLAIPAGHLTADTIVGTTTGRLVMTPAAGVAARITIADLGPIDHTWDPFALSRGLIWHGSSEIRGTAKTTWSTAQPVAKGATTLTVADAAGWRVGDRLILGGAAYQLIQYKWRLVPQDDDVRIAAISGNVVTLDRPLAFAHAAIDAQNPVVVNMTRNVVVQSANPTAERRGHLMFMHNPDQNISFAEFNDLGRTDKSRNVSTPDGKGGGLANPVGRYALHLHRTGTQSQAVHVKGVALSGSPGWGLVNHDSNVHADGNVSYNVFGAHFVTELGNEKGSFTNNVAIRADGTGALMGSLTELDFGHSGEGFWIEGSQVPLTGNVAIGMRSAGFTIFSPGNEAFTFRDNVSLQSTNSLIVWTSRFPGVSFPQIPPAGTVFSQITGNLLHSGVIMGYSSCLDFENNRVLAFENNANSSGFSHTGVNGSIRYAGDKVTGFAVGVDMPTEGQSVVEGGYYDNLEVDLLVRNTQLNFPRTIDIDGPQFGSRAAWNVEMQISFFTYDLRPAYPRGRYQEFNAVPDWRRLFDRNSFAVSSNSQVTLDGQRLYFAEQGSAFEFGKLLTRFPAEIRYEPDGVTLATGESLYARGLVVGGWALPEGEQVYLDKVRGVLLR